MTVLVAVCMGDTKQGMLRNIEENVNRFAGETVTKKVMEGNDQISGKTDPRKVAEWVKGAMERLDSLVDEKTKFQIMENCGYTCAEVNKKLIEKAKARRDKYKSIDEFLDAEQRKPMRGTKLVRQGKVLYHYYTPHSFTRPMRCYCGLLRGLPPDEKISPTYCQCSKGFVKKYWEEILGKPVKVELLQSAVSGAQECKFEIHF
jgi:hypothetical protein